LLIFVCQTFSNQHHKTQEPMSVVSKALDLLQQFTPARPEIGLSQIGRLAGMDKATAYRHMTALEAAGFVEKNPLTKAYRIGPAVLHLAQMRELTVPRKEGARTALETLADVTGETAHLSVLSGADLHALMSRESDRHGTRAIIDVTILPLHATGSGLCALAFGAADLLAAARADLTRYTDDTAADEQALNGAVAQARASGFGFAEGSFEDGILGISAPVFDQSGLLAGTVAVASVASRVTPELDQVIRRELVTAAREITRNWGGSIPAHVETAWAGTLAAGAKQDPVT
jgi:DNA-binding IclR family transcriptional regulator